jgi:hypothetical protein
MKQIFDQIVALLQQGISAIFNFIQLIWTWSINQIAQLTQLPWQSWPIWKQIAFALVALAVVSVLFKAGKELWEAGERILSAFAALLSVLVRTLPLLLIAGLIAAGGTWVINATETSGLLSGQAQLNPSASQKK